MNDTVQTKTICFLGKTQMRHHDYDYFAFEKFPLFKQQKCLMQIIWKLLEAIELTKGEKILEKKLAEWLILFKAWFIKGIFFEIISRGIQIFSEFLLKTFEILFATDNFFASKYYFLTCCSYEHHPFEILVLI